MKPIKADASRAKGASPAAGPPKGYVTLQDFLNQERAEGAASPELNVQIVTKQELDADVERVMNECKPEPAEEEMRDAADALRGKDK